MRINAMLLGVITAIISGILTVVVIGFLTPLLMLGELAGPKNFGPPYMTVIIVMSLLSAALCRIKGFFQGLIYGLLYSLPIICFLQIGANEPTMSEHAGQMRQIMLPSLILPMLFSAMICAVRKTEKCQ